MTGLAEAALREAPDGVKKCLLEGSEGESGTRMQRRGGDGSRCTKKGRGGCRALAFGMLLGPQIFPPPCRWVFPR